MDILTKTVSAMGWLAQQDADLELIRKGNIAIGVIAVSSDKMWANRTRDGEIAEVANRQEALDFLLNR